MKELTWLEFVVKLPDEINFKEDIYVTGGLANRGTAKNDIDLITNADRKNVKQFFGLLFRMSIGCGTEVWEMIPTPRKILIYKNGKCVAPSKWDHAKIYPHVQAIHDILTSIEQIKIDIAKIKIKLKLR